MTNTVLLVAGGSFQGTSLIAALRELPDTRIVLADTHSTNINSARVDRVYELPTFANQTSCVESLRTLLLEERPTAVFPCTDSALNFVANHQILFTEYQCNPACPTFPILDELADKRRVKELFKAAHVPFRENIDIESGIIKFPLRAKKRTSSGGRDCYVLYTPEDLKHFVEVEDTDQFVFEEWFFKYTEFSSDFAISLGGQIGPIVTRTREQSISGVSVVSTEIHSAVIEGHVNSFATILSNLRIAGIFNLQFICPENSDCLASDFNPRIGTSSCFSLGVGVNLPKFVLDGRPQHTPRKNHRVTMLRNLGSTFLPRLRDHDIRAVMFDLDDTLISLKEWYIQKLDFTYEALKERLPARDIFLEECIQLLEEGFQRDLFDRLTSLLQLSQQLKEDLIRTFRGATPPQLPLIPGALGLLRSLKDDGLKVGLISNGGSEMQRQKISLCPFEFDAVLISGEVGEEKPHLKFFELASKSLGEPLSRIVSCGDNVYRDALGAVRAGCPIAFHVTAVKGVFNHDLARLSKFDPVSSSKIFPIQELGEILVALRAS